MSIFLISVFIFVGLIALAHRHDKIRTGSIKRRWYDL